LKCLGHTFTEELWVSIELLLSDLLRQLWCKLKCLLEDLKQGIVPEIQTNSPVGGQVFDSMHVAHLYDQIVESLKTDVKMLARHLEQD
jgi:hypothetical protein